MPPRTRTGTQPTLHDRLSESFLLLQAPFALAGDTYCEGIINQRSPLLVDSLIELSEQNSTVKRALEMFTQGSAVGAVVFSALSIAIPIAQHHGMMGGSDPFGGLFEGVAQAQEYGNGNGNGSFPNPEAAFAPSAAPEPDDVPPPMSDAVNPQFTQQAKEAEARARRQAQTAGRTGATTTPKRRTV